MPYLTPDEIPEDDVCRPLLIPASSEWLAIVSGALTELTKSWNWEQQGSVTVDEAVARMLEMTYAYYSDPCGDCELPGGSPPLRLGEEGNVEQLIDGAWSAPVGDYEIPALPARTEPTADERKCLAAKNAANVLAQVYEDTLDSFTAGAAEAELMIDFALLLGAALFAPFGLIAVGLYGMFTFGWKMVFELFENIVTDVWDAKFTEELVCILLKNSTDTAGVVTFDFNAVTDSIRTNLNQMIDLTGFQHQLALQLAYMLPYIGAEGLNLAGTTTDITDSDCDACQATWALYCDFKLGSGGFNWGVPSGWTSQVSSQYMPSVGFYAAEARVGAGEWLNQIAANRAFVSMELTKVRIFFTAQQGVTVPSGAVPYRRSIDQGATALVDEPNNEGLSLTWEGYIAISAFGQTLQFTIFNGYRNDGVAVGGGGLVTGWYMEGIGTTPSIPGGSEWQFVEPGSV